MTDDFIPYHLPAHADPRKPNCGLTEEELAQIPEDERRLIKAEWEPVNTPFRMAPVHARNPRATVFVEPPVAP